MENLNKLCPFYVGQKVIYITGIKMKKNSLHTVTGIFKDPCGCWTIFINNEIIETLTIKEGEEYDECDICAKRNIKGTVASGGWMPSSFRSVEESPFPNMTLKEVIKKELTLVSLN